MSAQLFARPAKQRQFHSRDHEQAVIDIVKAGEAEQIKKTLLTNAQNRSDVANTLLDKIGQSDMELIVRCLDRGEIGDRVVMSLLRDRRNESIADVAEYRAIKAVEEHGTDVLG